MVVLSPAEIAAAMDGRLRPAGSRLAAFLPSPAVQNHAAFLSRDDGGLVCHWFGGSLEGRSDIAIFRARLAPGADAWGPAETVSDDPDRSEQNPVAFVSPDRRRILFHTAQPGGDQNRAVVRMREGGTVRDLPLPPGSFVRGAVHVRDDGAWLLPLFRCIDDPGRRWTGRLDTAHVAISADGGRTWRLVDVPDSVGSVHMTIVPLADRLAAFYRRRQADYVHRSESRDGGETWSPPEPTDVPNNNSSIVALALPDGRVALVGNPVNAAMSADRRLSLYDELGAAEAETAAPDDGGCVPVWGVPRAPLTLAVSRDGGRTFPARRVLDDGPGTCLSNNSTDGRNFELSYPAAIPAPDGGLDIAYTVHRRAIRHLRVAAADIPETP